MTIGAFLRLTVAAGLVFALLLGLGFWQLQRLQWKEGLIAQIEARTEQSPVTLERAMALSDEPEDLRYLPVRVEGRFDHSRERYLYSISLEGEPGWHVVTPLKTSEGSEGSEGTVVLVDRGFVPEAFRDPQTRPSGQPEAAVSVTGLIRTSQERGLFVPENEPETNQWFTRDLAAMVRTMYPDGVSEVAPFFLEAVSNDVPGGWPKGGQTRLQLPNNHLQYAVTWFGLALCLVVVYGVYVWGAVRRERP